MLLALRMWAFMFVASRIRIPWPVVHRRVEQRPTRASSGVMMFAPFPDQIRELFGYCAPPCDARSEAVRLRLMQWSPRWSAWVFPDCRGRSVSGLAKSLIAVRGGANHTGESYRYAAHEGSCPWCGRMLPAGEEAPAQADGEDGG